MDFCPSCYNSDSLCTCTQQTAPLSAPKQEPREYWVPVGALCDTKQECQFSFNEIAVHVVKHSVYLAVCQERDAAKAALKHDCDKIEAAYYAENQSLEKRIAELEREREELETEQSRVIIATRDMAAASHRVKNAYIAGLEQKVNIMSVALERCASLFRYCYGPTRDVKTYKLKEGEQIATEALKGDA